jgi:DNA-binding transcriptional regulator YdaS (Cro superfamily)
MSTQMLKKAVARAAEVLGGEDALAAYLGTDTEQVRRWMRASTPPPARVLQSISCVIRAEIVRKATRAKLATRKR